MTDEEFANAIAQVVKRAYNQGVLDERKRVMEILQFTDALEDEVEETK